MASMYVQRVGGWKCGAWIGICVAAMGWVGVAPARADLVGFGKTTTTADFAPSPPRAPSTKLYSYDNGVITVNYVEGEGNKYNTFVPPTVRYAGGEAPPAYKSSHAALTNLTHFSDQGSSAAVWFNKRQAVGKPWTLQFTWSMLSTGYGKATAIGHGVAGAPGSGFFVVIQNNAAGTKLISPAWNGRGILVGKWPHQTVPTACVAIGIRTDCYYTGKKWQYNNVGLACSYQSPKGGVQRADYYPSGLSGLHSTGTVNFSAFDAPVRITIVYDGKNHLTFKAVQKHGGLKANGTGSYNFTVKLPESISKLLGNKTGLVGITGGTTACQATEDIKMFSFHGGA